MSVDINCLASLLTEALAELEELSRKVMELEKKISNMKESELSLGNGTLPVKSKNIPLSISLSNESNNSTNIDKAIDYVLKLGKNLSYISEK